jgi:3',5'-cyclic AMP phosphodiesterase CpdA
MGVRNLNTAGSDRSMLAAQFARYSGAVRHLILCIAASALSACGADNGPDFRPSPQHSIAVLVGAGDIAECGSRGAEATARLLDGIPGIVFTAGDNAYQQGSAQNYRNCYDPTWGRHKDRTRPAPGNHEYDTAGAVAYFAYYGAAAGPSGLGYYSFHAGPWQVISLNSNVPMDRNSPQLQWLRQELTSRAGACTAAIFHHPPFSSGPNGDQAVSRDLWRELNAGGVDIAITGHDHLYERFAPQNADGRADTVRGVRLFVVGTGGATLYPIMRMSANSEVRLVAFGVLKLTLSAEGYQWEFISGEGLIRDSGRGVCH